MYIRGPTELQDLTFGRVWDRQLLRETSKVGSCSGPSRGGPTGPSLEDRPVSLSIARPPGPIAADPEDALYPDSDGEPIAENTLQFEWIVTIKGNLDLIFADRGDVFVAGDLLWYPVHGDPKIRTAPDALVAIGRPKGYRGSYRQWREGGIAPQVVFEVLSPGNRAGEMKEKFGFYERFGVL